MKLSSLLVCADEAARTLLQRVLEELDLQFELCPDPARATVRLVQERFDLIVLDCDEQNDVVALLKDGRNSRTNESSMAVVVVSGQESIREMFALGVNFVLYRPLSYERALSTLRAAQTVLRRDKRRKVRTAVHTHAMVDYADVAQARATLVDLAEDGMAVNFGKKLPPTSKVYFQFQLPGQRSTVRLSGQVMWQDWNGRAGVQFADVPQASRRLLQDWLKEHLADAPARDLAEDTVEVQHSLRSNESSTAVDAQPKTKAAQQKPAKNPVKNNAQSELVGQHETKIRELQEVSRLREDTSNRRSQTRYTCRIGAEVYQQGSNVRNYCHLSDLGPGGCYLEMPLAFSTGTAVEIIVRTHAIKLRLSGLVKASHPGYGMGISFLVNTKAEREGVQQLIDFAAAEAATENS